MLWSSKRRKLVFHIGHHKTGSTSIQDALALGQVKVAGQKILYPSVMAHNYLVGHFKAFVKNGAINEGGKGRPNLERIEARLKAGKFDTAILSGEEFEDYDPKHFRKVLDRFMLPHVDEHLVLAYVRPHAARTVSSFSEQCKLGLLSGNLAEFHARQRKGGRFIYAPKLQDWADQIGPQFEARVMVRSALRDGSILQDFLEAAFGAEAEVTLTNDPVANTSLCVEDLVMVRHIQARLSHLPAGLRHHLGWQLVEAMGPQSPEATQTRLTLDRALAEDIRKTYIDDAKALDTSIFRATPVMVQELDRAVDTAIPTAQSLDPASYFSPQTLRHVDGLIETLGTVLETPPQDATWGGILNANRVAKLYSKTRTGWPRAK